MEWIPATNIFMTIAEESRPRAIKVADYTYDALQKRQAEPFSGPLFTAFKIVYDPLKAEQAALEMQKGTQKGSTKTVDDYLIDLVEKIGDWDIAISNVYKPGTPQYLALLPNGHSKFTKGKKDERILAVKALGLALTGIAPLAAVKTEVDAFFTAINDAREAQQGEKSTTKDNSDEVTDKLRACMVGLFKVYGACVIEFAETPQDIKPFFDIATIQDHAQTLWIDTVKKGTGTTENIFKRTLAAGRFVKVTVLSDKALDFYVADEKNDAAGLKKVTVQGGEEEVLDVNSLKASPKSSFFKVANLDDDIDGHFKIEILPEGTRGVTN